MGQKNNLKVYFCKIAFCTLYSRYKRSLKDVKSRKYTRAFLPRTRFYSLSKYSVRALQGFELSQGTKKSLSLLVFEWYGLILYKI
jgi:hypothetical protein